VYGKEPFAVPQQVLRYPSRYTHRVAISNLPSSHSVQKSSSYPLTNLHHFGIVMGSHYGNLMQFHEDKLDLLQDSKALVLTILESCAVRTRWSSELDRIAARATRVVRLLDRSMERFL
jgi:hypothetical protein